MEAYYVKCRAEREMKDTRAITMKNSRPMTQGVYPQYGTRIFRKGKSRVFTGMAISIEEAEFSLSRDTQPPLLSSEDDTTS